MTRLVYSDFNFATGRSIVVINTDLGEFSGEAYLHPEDTSQASRFFGCSLAEGRAYIKYLKARKRLLRAELKALIDFKSVIESVKDYDEHHITARKLRRQIAEKKEAIQNIINLIENVKSRLRKDVELRDRIYEKRSEEKGE